MQMNVRVPATMKVAIETRRRLIGVSRDEWVRRALTWALQAPVGTPCHTPLPDHNGRRP